MTRLHKQTHLMLRCSVTLPMMVYSLCLIGLSSCAAAGTNFSFDSDRIVVGETTETAVRSTYGKPLSTRHLRSESGGEVVLSKYFYLTRRMAVRSHRSLNFEFRDGVVNGYVYRSSFAEDSTAFDLNSKSQIILDETTQWDVSERLGKPDGVLLVPTNLPVSLWGHLLDSKPPEDARFLWVYNYIVTKEVGLRLETRKTLLVIYFAGNGIVKDIGHHESAYRTFASESLYNHLF